MLLSQDFGGRHQGHVVTALDRHQRGTGGDDSFAGTDISLEQSAHRVRSTHGLPELAQDGGLGAGKFEWQRGQKRANEAIVRLQRQRF